MKNIFEIRKGVVALFVCAACFSCSDNTELGLPAKDNIPPTQPEVTKIRNTNGGAIIHYKVPTDEDLSYVEAIYIINGKQYITKSSVHVDSITVQGFGKEGEYSIDLKSVDMSRNESAPLSVKISPKKSPVELIYETLNVQTAFGGIQINWKNPTEANVIVSVYYKDEIGDWVSLDNFYSSTKQGKGTVRGLDTTPKLFGVKVRDRWDNYSEILESENAPYFEEEIDRSKFKALPLKFPNDGVLHGASRLEYLWDGSADLSRSYFTDQSQSMNDIASFDMGQVAKLSRFKLWQLTSGNGWFYKQSNLKNYDIYGCTEITAKMYETGTWDGWTLLCSADCYKPTGEGPVTNEDIEYIKQGDEHEIGLDAPAVRYIRIHMKTPWENTGQRAIGDIKFWGEVQK